MSASFPLPADGRFGVVHHRKLNTRAGVEEALAAADALPGYLHVAEGDLCWARVDGALVHYFHHPDRLVDTLSAADLDRRRAEGTLWTLDDALDPRYDGLVFIVELKTGTGPRAAAIAAAAAKLAARRPGRFWFDTFSPSDARIVKRTEPTACVSLHTRFLAGPLLFKTAPELFPLGVRTVRGLRDVDIVTPTWRYTPQRWLGWAGVTPERAARAVRALGKTLVFGGVQTEAMFRRLERSGARAGYIKFDWRALR